MQPEEIIALFYQNSIPLSCIKQNPSKIFRSGRDKGLKLVYTKGGEIEC